MGAFLAEDFLLETGAARRLYFDHAATQPIYDYHSHLIPSDISQDRRFHDLTELWLDGDHYKWRAMRTAGVEERLITGDAKPYERFAAFARVVPLCIGNPIYHWTHMELRKPFGIDLLLSAATADQVWSHSQVKLAENDFGAQGLLRQFNVEVVCTTDDPVDSLDEHRALASSSVTGIRMLPTWRPDAALKPDRDEFPGWIEQLGEVTDSTITSIADLQEALRQRLAHFAALGCVSADHGLDCFEYSSDTQDVEAILSRRLRGLPLSRDEVVGWRSWLLDWLGRQYATLGWVMQLHIGAQRDNNSRMLARLGPNTGFDSIGDAPFADALAKFLDGLDRESSLPKTILYCLNPRDNEVLATMAGNFHGDGIDAKVQFGSAWWFNDQADGIHRHLTSVAQMSLLGSFVGMLTDSRSLLSFSRHEYFRRILCNLLGRWIEDGLAPADYTLLGNLVENICYRNTIAYFGFDRVDQAGCATPWPS